VSEILSYHALCMSIAVVPPKREPTRCTSIFKMCRASCKVYTIMNSFEHWSPTNNIHTLYWKALVAATRALNPEDSATILCTTQLDYAASDASTVPSSPEKTFSPDVVTPVDFTTHCTAVVVKKSKTERKKKRLRRKTEPEMEFEPPTPGKPPRSWGLAGWRMKIGRPVTEQEYVRVHRPLDYVGDEPDF